MEGDMDVLPFSLSCDRCAFRTKSMSAMRQHATNHQMAPDAQREGEMSDVGASNDALQALVDSALSEASGLLLSTRTSHHEQMDHASRHLVEEVGRADTEANTTLGTLGCRTLGSNTLGNSTLGNSTLGSNTLGHSTLGNNTLGCRTLGSESPNRTSAAESSASEEAASLEADDLLGIYAAEIDFCDVGDDDGHFRDVSNQVVQTKTGVASRVLSQGEGRMDLNESTMSHITAEYGRTGGSCTSHGRYSVNDVQMNKTETMTRQFLPQKALAEGNCSQAIDTRPDRILEENNDRQSISRAGDVSATNRTILQKEFDKTASGLETRCEAGMRSLRSSRPSFQSLHHRSAFTQTSCPSNEESKALKKKGRHLQASRNSVKSEFPEASQTSVATTRTNLRTCRQKAKLDKEKVPQNVAEEPPSQKRRGRKAACPVKVVARKEEPVKRRGVGRPRKFPVKETQKEPCYKCLECPFSCEYKKDLAAHIKVAHKKQTRLGRVQFEIGTCKRKRVPRGEDKVNVAMVSVKGAGKLRYHRNKIKEIKHRKRRTQNSNERLSSTHDGSPVKQRLTERKRSVNRSKKEMDQIEETEEMFSNEEISDCENEADDSICGICQEFVAESPAEMARHIAQIHNDNKRSSKQFKCNFCEYSCRVRKTLAAHLLKVHNEVKQENILDEVNHKDTHGEVEQEVQIIASKVKPKRKTREQHPGRTYGCNLCDFTCDSSHVLNSHMKSQHNFEKMTGEFICNVCGKVVVGRYSHFRRHLRSHSDERPYKCDQCDLAFRDLNSLNCHKPIHKEDRDYLCEDCGMAFKRPINLRMHRKVHSNKMFSCEECDYRCRRRNTLLNHQKRKHLKQKTVLCQHCGHRFFSKTECKNHVMKKHTPRPTPFACPSCPAVFMFQYRFKAHLKTHPEIKPYKCTYCGFETRLSTYLADHMRQHTGEKPKKCSQCDYQTSTNSNLYKHRKRHHGPPAPGLAPRTRKLRNAKPGALKDERESVLTNDSCKDPGEKAVEEAVVEYGQLSAQMGIGSTQQQGALFSMAHMNSSHDLKQEHLMQGVGLDLSQGLAQTHQVPSCVPGDPGPSSDRPTMGLLDKTSTSSVVAMMEALAEARNMRQPVQTALPHPHPHTYPLHLATSTPASSDGNQVSNAPIYQRASTNMTMHYVHPNMTTMGGGVPGGVQASHYHHLTALTGEAAARAPIASHPQPTATHNPSIPSALIGMAGQGHTPPPPLGHFPNMMHF